MQVCVHYDPDSGCTSPSLSKGIMSVIFYVYDFVFETNESIKCRGNIITGALISASDKAGICVLGYF